MARVSPAYVEYLRQSWRVVVPIRGRLSPQILPAPFPTRQAAYDWLATDEGQARVEHARCAIRPASGGRPAPVMAGPSVATA